MPESYFAGARPEDVGIVPLLESRAEADPAATFFSFGDRCYRIGEFNADVNRFARNLRRLGIRRGTHVGVLMDTSPDYLTLMFALAKIGAIELPINTAYHGDLLQHQLRTGQVTVCVLDDAYMPAVSAVLSEVTELKQLIVRGQAESSASARVSSFDELTAAADTANLGNVVTHDSVAGIIFTSGTTGPSKGVLLTHHYLAAYGYMYADINGLRADDVLLNFLPFFHIGAKFMTIATLVCAGTMRLQPRLSVSTFREEVRKHGITNFVGVGGICNMLLARPPQADDADTTIRTIYAVPDPDEIHSELEHRFGCKITTVYGSTEVGLPIFRSATDEYRPGSCGRRSPYYDVIVVDENDNALPPGAVGEIAVRPRRPFLLGSGYIGMEARTIEAWRNLWLHSGDRGRVDSDGWFYFEDRLTDSIRRRGENISSFEVERMVVAHPAVSEAVAIAVPSPVGEDDVRVLVIVREGAVLHPPDLLRYCAEVMPYFMVPRYIDIVTDFPRTPTAKVEKYRLRAAGINAGTWDRDAHGFTVTRSGLVGPGQAGGDAPAGTPEAASGRQVRV